MTSRQSFSQFLVGTASLERPAFFYAYSGMWLHLIISVPVFIFLVGIPAFDAVASMAISSLSAGIILYSLLSREYALLINAVSYVLSLGRAVTPEIFTYSFLVVAVIISMASGYLLITREYRRYSREVYSDSEGGVPLWITVLIGTTLLLLFIYGIRLL